MSEPQREVIEPVPGCRSREAAIFLAQLQAKRAEMLEDLRGATPAELAWQPAPGMNTIGMLLAHIAIVEVFWTQIGLEHMPADGIDEALAKALDFGVDDDGMPIPPGAAPPATLAGKTLADYETLLRRSSDYSRAVIAKLTDDDIEREFTRRRRSGAQETMNVRWVLYHMLEHEAGHHAQVNLLRHHARLAGVPARA
jgi:uncharacterized damage-inducible protein DinB